MSRDQTLPLIFSALRVICRSSINLRIEVHTFFCLHWKMKGHWSRVNLLEALRASQDLHVTSVLLFPNANKNVYMYFNPLYFPMQKNVLQ